jgi:shikimate kinase
MAGTMSYLCYNIAKSIWEGSRMKIFVIGFIGSDRIGLAQDLARQHGYDYIDLDKEIEKADGRSIMRICMTMGEHEYRNKEYEALSKVCAQENIVVACGDGIVLDEMNVRLLKEHRVVVADAEKSPEQLWENCCADSGKDTLPYAFLHHGSTAEKKEKFTSLYMARRALYQQVEREVYK